MITKNTKEDKARFTLQSTLDSINYDILLVDENNEVDYVNIKAKTNLFGDIEEGDDIFKLLDKFFTKHTIANKKALDSIIEEVAKPDSFVSESIKIVITDPVPKVYELLTSPIYDQTLGLIGRIWQFRDITIEENLDRLKSDFISIASHQLRTPITTIKGYAAMVLDGDFGPVGENLLEPIDAVLKSSDRMSQLIDDLLDISRLENNTHLEIRDIKISSFIKDIVKNLENKAKERNVTVATTTNIAEDFTINTDATKLTESISNLIDNAIKYSHENSTVKVNTTMEARNLIITVEDAGIGIPEDQQTQIFQKFFRANNVLTDKIDGTGLGLYYVKNAIQSIGGKISFTSSVGKGTIFKVELKV